PPFERPCGVGVRTAGAQRRSDPDRFHHLGLTGSLATGQLGVPVDAVRTLGGVGDRHRDQLLRPFRQCSRAEYLPLQRLPSVVDPRGRLFTTLGHLLCAGPFPGFTQDRKSTRLNSSHVSISYAVFYLKKKK